MTLRDLFAKLPGSARKLVGRQVKVELPVAPVLLLATGAGVAVWWWTQWARGHAESREGSPAEAGNETSGEH